MQGGARLEDMGDCTGEVIEDLQTILLLRYKYHVFWPLTKTVS